MLLLPGMPDTEASAQHKVNVKKAAFLTATATLVWPPSLGWLPEDYWDLTGSGAMK